MSDQELEARIRNQLRIHWKWLKDTDANNVADFIMSIQNDYLNSFQFLQDTSSTKNGIEGFDDGLTQVAPKGQFKAGKDIHSQNKELMDKDYAKDKQKGTDGGNDGK